MRTNLKSFLLTCVANYSGLGQHIANLTPLGTNFPLYSERTECGSAEKPLWGQVKLGRLPAFLYADIHSQSGQQFSTSHSVQQSCKDPIEAVLQEEYRRLFDESRRDLEEDAEADANSTDVEDTRFVQETCPLGMDGASYKQQFDIAFQYSQRRCQHHIHKLVKGKRVVPNACRSKAKPTECKHEAPWTNRVSPPWMTTSLLICKGLAKRFKLRCSGMRNWFGQTLLLRNDAIPTSKPMTAYLSQHSRESLQDKLCAGRLIW